VSLHTYGKNTNHTVRCQIDPETGKVEEFKIPLREG
jgi:competence protein ComGF